MQKKDQIKNVLTCAGLLLDGLGHLHQGHQGLGNLVSSRLLGRLLAASQEGKNLLQQLSVGAGGNRAWGTEEKSVS